MIPLSKLIFTLPRSQVTRIRNLKYTVPVGVARFPIIEGIQGDARTESFHDSRKALEETVDYSVHGPSVQGVQGGHDEFVDVLQKEQLKETFYPKPEDNIDALGCNRSLNLHGCMQSNVPQPFHTNVAHYESPYNLPGNGRLQLQKYVNDAVSDTHPSRKYHTSSQLHAAVPKVDESVAPQGIQGEGCTLELWMESCMRYKLPNCKEELQNLKEGRKTLSQVFTDQEELIKEIAESYKDFRGKNAYVRLNLKPIEADTPCPQGVQGDDCVRFQLWLENCQRFSFGECQEQINGIRSGRKTLKQVCDDQDSNISEIVSNYYQKRSYSTSTNKKESEVGRDLASQSNTEKLSQKDRLKRAVKEYGSTVVVFHVGISLVSLGGFYLAVSRYF